ncbi:transposase [Gammaproteobacteria bacterium]
MGKAYSMDLRKRVIDACNEGESAARVSERFAVSESFIEKLKRHFRESGTLAPRPHAGGRPLLLAEHDETILSWLKEKPDTTLKGLREALGLPVQLSTLWYRLNHLELTFKKTLNATERERDDVQARRKEWLKEQPTLNPDHLVFVDETGLTTAMVRLHGWGPRGERVVGTAPQGHWHTTTFVAALRRTGLTAPMVTGGPMNGELFLAYTREFLCPTLSAGDIVIWDNLSSHQMAGVCEAIEARGAILKPLPPYSPDFNPIEQAFSKLKALLRKAAERTHEALWNTVGEILNEFSPTECENYLRGAGYAVQSK